MQRPKNTIEHDHGAGSESVGRKLAVQKGAKGSQVRWIDVTWTRTDETLETSLKQEMLEEVQTATTEFVDSSVVAVINMKTHTGNCNHIADIETVWRPALAEPWVALAYQDKEEPRPGSTPGVSGKVDEALAWTNACLQGMAGTPVVQYTLEGFHTIPGEVQITTDLSPRELGALLVVRGTPIAWFATALTEEDVQAFGQAVGDPCEQQTWEGSAVGLAHRVWQDQWTGKRSLIKVPATSWSRSPSCGIARRVGLILPPLPENSAFSSQTNPSLRLRELTRRALLSWLLTH